MSLNLNKTILAGRLTAKPELKQTPNGIAVCTFTLAVNRKGKDAQTDFIDCVAWRQTAEFVSNYFDKGNAICIVGSLQKRSWEGKNGEKRSVTEVVADEAYFVEGKNSADGAYDPAVDQMPAPTFKATPKPKFEELKTDEDLPF